MLSGDDSAPPEAVLAVSHCPKPQHAGVEGRLTHFCRRCKVRGGSGTWQATSTVRQARCQARERVRTCHTCVQHTLLLLLRCLSASAPRSVPCLRRAWVVYSLSAAGGPFVPRVQVLVCARCGVAEHLDEGHTVVPLASAGADAEAVIASALPQLAACADRLQGTVAQVQVCPVRAVVSMLVCGQARKWGCHHSRP